MTASVRNRLLILGVLWGLVLAAVPALVMTDPYKLTGFLVVALLCAAVSGAAGTLVAGRRTMRRASGRKGTRGAAALRGIAVGAVQGIVAGALAALLFWTVMALTISGFTLRDPVEIAVLMSPRIFLGSFFVALSAFAYTLVGGLLLGPLFGLLVERTVSKEKELVR